MDTNSIHEVYMQRCLELAAKGAGKVAPNPKVGAVVVHNQKIIGEGYHARYGESHAEVHAIQSVKHKELLKESIIYVSLEPCSHHGKTPPCADLIVANKIPHVVIGMQDPFAKVNGEGIKRLKSAGCKVTVGVLESACWDLNKEFVMFHTKQRPYVVLKWAQTLDGLIDKTRDAGAIQEPNWITNEVCRSLVHKWRSEIQSIMVGTNTAIIDNPQLNIRSWAGKNPMRIVIDRKLQLPHNLKVFDKSSETLILNELVDKQDDNLIFIKMHFGEAFLRDLMQVLYGRGINSLLVEGGQNLLQAFINQNIWDEARIFTGNKYFNNGVAAPGIKGTIVYKEPLRDNMLTVYKNT
jgi:diaminohydroxyphosphoribosylaminopyrimidine deaminase/5-amino-6-(5-phosphoribosylamino)uracil reductase